MKSKSKQTGRYRKLDPEMLTRTCDLLSKRIAERFPNAALVSISRDLVSISVDTTRLVRWLDRPILWARGLVVVLGILIVILASVALRGVYFREVQPADANKPYSSIADALQGFDAMVNELLLLGGALYFVSSLERRIKRRRTLEALHGLRSMAHIVDMHQLTKDPGQLLTRGPSTRSSPVRDMPPYELTRYLGYSSELLSLISKIAALHVQEFDDSVALSAVDELEGLCTGVASRIWLKILIVDRGLG